MKKKLLVIGMAVVLTLFGCSNSTDTKKDNVESTKNTEKTKEMQERTNLAPSEKVTKIKEYISNGIDNGDDVITSSTNGNNSCYTKNDSKELLLKGKKVSPYFYWKDEKDIFSISYSLEIDSTEQATIDDEIDKIDIYNTAQSIQYNSTSMGYGDLSLYGGKGLVYTIELASANDKEDKSKNIDNLYEIFNSSEDVYINLTYVKDGVETLTVTDYLKKIMLAELKYYKEALTYLSNEIQKNDNATGEALPTPVVSTEKESAKKIKLKQSIKTDFIKMKLIGSKITRKLTPSGSYDSYKKLPV